MTRQMKCALCPHVGTIRTTVRNRVTEPAWELTYALCTTHRHTPEPWIARALGLDGLDLDPDNAARTILTRFIDRTNNQ